MNKILVIVVILVAVVVWALAYLVPILPLPFNPITGFTIIAISALAGLAILLIVKHLAVWIPLNLVAQILGIIIFAVALPLVIVKLLTAIYPPFRVDPIVYCDKVVVSNPNPVSVDPIEVQRFGVVSFEIRSSYPDVEWRIDTYKEINCTTYQPVVGSSRRPLPDRSGRGPQKLPVDSIGDSGCFKYSVSCKNPGASWKTVDPMIWVPR